MGFGNPYGDRYEPGLVSQFADILVTLGSSVISLADTIGAATPELITDVVGSLMKQKLPVEIGVHLHSNPTTAREKIDAAYLAGCRRFDGALRGFGGCPMANDSLVGNLATETILEYLEEKGELLQHNKQFQNEALVMSREIFPNH
jgi:hydroxymethylglutaryl-CoA lyase